MYKRLEWGSFQWPRSSAEALELNAQQYRWLMENLSMEQPKAHIRLKNLERKREKAGVFRDFMVELKQENGVGRTVDKLELVE